MDVISRQYNFIFDLVSSCCFSSSVPLPYGFNFALTKSTQVMLIHSNAENMAIKSVISYIRQI